MGAWRHEMDFSVSNVASHLGNKITLHWYLFYPCYSLANPECLQILPLLKGKPIMMATHESMWSFLTLGTCCVYPISSNRDSNPSTFFIHYSWCLANKAIRLWHSTLEQWSSVLATQLLVKQPSLTTSLQHSSLILYKDWLNLADFAS